MPEKDKDKSPKNVSDTDTLRKRAKLVKEAPTGPEWEKLISDGEEIYVKRAKGSEPDSTSRRIEKKPIDINKVKTKYVGAPPKDKPKKDIEKRKTPPTKTDEDEVVRVVKDEEEPNIPTPPTPTEPTPKQKGMYGSIKTYRKIVPEASSQDYQAYDYPDATGNYTNKAIRKYSVGIDVIDPAKSYDAKGNFKPFFTGEKLPDPQLQQISTAGFDDVVDDRGPNYKGSLMMPGTKATRMAGGGGGEFNQMNVGKIPGALSTAPVGYIEQKYDTQGNPIVTPNVGVQMDTKNITPLRKGEMEVGKMYDIPSEEPVLIPGKFAKGGSVKAPKIKKYESGTGVDGLTTQQRNEKYGVNTQGSIQPGTVQIGGGQGQYGVTGNATTATGETSAQTGDTKKNKKEKTPEQLAKEEKARQDIGGALGAYGKSYVASAPDTGSQDSLTKTTMGTIGGVVGGAYGIIDSIARPEKNRAEKIDVKYDASGKPVAKLRSEARAKDTAVAGFFLSPSEAITTRAAYGGWDDFSGHGYTKYLEKKAQEQLDPYIKANAEYKQQQAVANRNAGNLEGAKVEDIYNLTSATYGDNKQINLQPAANGGVIGAAKMRYAKGGTIVGKGGPKEDAILTKANDKGIAPGSFIVPAENNDKAKGIRAALFGNGNKKAEFKKEGGETKADVAVSNGEHLFTPKERKKIINYLGEEILEELAPDAEENNEEKEMNMGGMLGNMTDRTNMREYVKGGLTKSKAKIMLHEGMANGKPITEQQRKYFGWVAGGSKESKMDGGDIHGYAMGTDVEGVEGIPVSNKTYAELITPPYSWKGSKEAYKAAADKAIKEGKVIPKGSTATKNEVKSNFKAPSVKGGKKTSQSFKFVPKMASESEGEDVIVPGSPKYESDESIIGPDPFSEEEKRKREKASLARVSDSTAPTSPSAPRKGLGDYVGNVDPTSIAAMMQIAGGKKLLAKGSRPVDVSKIDPTWNAAVERAQRDASFGYTPEQAVLLEQQRINALNDARFAGRNLAGGSASNAYQQELQAINKGWSNALQLKSSDQQLRMEKQQYADQAVRDRAAFLDSQRRRAFGDAMTTYDINQESGSALVGAGVRNAIGAYRYQKELDAQEKAAKVAGAPVYKG